MGIFESDDANDLPFEASFRAVHNGDVLSLPVLDDLNNRKAIGKGSWRAILLKRNDDRDATVLAKSDAFTVLEPGDRPPPCSAPDSYWVACGRKGFCTKKHGQEKAAKKSGTLQRARWPTLYKRRIGAGLHQRLRLWI